MFGHAICPAYSAQITFFVTFVFVIPFHNKSIHHQNTVKERPNIFLFNIPHRKFTCKVNNFIPNRKLYVDFVINK